MQNYNQFLPMGYNPYMPNVLPQYSFPQNYGQNQQSNYQQSNNNSQNTQNYQNGYNPPMNTNIIYVNGIEDAKNRPLPFNSNYAFWDNDKAMVYRKVVDSMGKMSVEPYDIIPHQEESEKKSEPTQSIDTSAFVTRKEYEALKSQLEQQNLLIRQITQQQSKQVSKSPNSSSMEVSK